MARYTCPSCGSSFDGKKCRSCLYESFSEEYAHGNHTHQGEPLVIDAPVRAPIPKQDPFSCPPKQNPPKTSLNRSTPDISPRKERKSHPFLRLLLILWITIGVLCSVIDAVLDHSDTQQPMPEVDLSDLTVLYADDQYTIRTDFQEGQTYDQGFHIFLENNTRKAVTLYAENLIVNGYLIDHSPFYCSAKKRSSGWDSFQISSQDMSSAGIEQVETLSFSLRIYDSQSYQILLGTQTFQLHTAVPEGFVQNVDDSGQLLLEQAGVRILYRGYIPNELHPELVHRAVLEFFLENDTDRTLSFSATHASIAGAKYDNSFYLVLPPHTRAITPMYLYSLEDLGLTAPEQLGQLGLSLTVRDSEDSDFSLTGEAVIAPSLGQ